FLILYLPSTPPSAACWAKLSRPCGAERRQVPVPSLTTNCKPQIPPLGLKSSVAMTGPKEAVGWKCGSLSVLPAPQTNAFQSSPSSPPAPSISLASCTGVLAAGGTSHLTLPA